MNSILVQLTLNLNVFSVIKMEFDDLFDDRSHATSIMVKIVKKEVLDIAD